MIDRTDTIVALSSPPGRSARGLLRISGPGVRGVLHGMFERPCGTDSIRAETAVRQLISRRIRWNNDGDVLPVLVTQFAAPRSYTGQDMAEMQSPGHPALLNQLIHRIIDRGARLAEPGEFTFRAYVAGKLDLTRAEGVAATITARSDAELHAARLLRAGYLGRLTEQLVDALGDQLALIEAGIDFTDQEDVRLIAPADLETNLTTIGGQLKELATRSRPWGELDALPRVVLVGAPSTGKSTLFNALLGRHRSVISTVPGTTRDVLAEPLILRYRHGQNVELMLVDMPGLDSPDSALDCHAQAAAHRAIKKADLILHLHDGRDGQWSESLDRIATCPRVGLRSKADLPGRNPPGIEVAVSATTGQGLMALRRLIVDRIGHRAVSFAAELLALQPRHEAALRSASDHIAKALRQLSSQQHLHALKDAELIAAAVRAALDDLTGLGGTLTPDDVIERIFSKFCVGK